MGLHLFIWRQNKRKKCSNGLCAPQRPQAGNNSEYVCWYFSCKRRKLTQNAVKSPTPLKLCCPSRNNPTLEKGSHCSFNIWHLSIPHFSTLLLWKDLASFSLLPKDLLLETQDSIWNSHYPREMIWLVSQSPSNAECASGQRLWWDYLSHV